MNNKIKKLTLAVLGSIICSVSIAQNTVPPIVIPINSNVGVGIQAPFLLGIAAANKARNDVNKENTENQVGVDNSVNKDMPTLESKKEQNSGTQSESEQEKAIKEAVLAKDSQLEDMNKVNTITPPIVSQPKVSLPQVDRITGQVPINNRIVRTNDIRLWNDSSIKEKEEVGQKNILNALEGK